MCPIARYNEEKTKIFKRWREFWGAMSANCTSKSLPRAAELCTFRCPTKAWWGRVWWDLIKCSFANPPDWSCLVEDDCSNSASSKWRSCRRGVVSLLVERTVATWAVRHKLRPPSDCASSALVYRNQIARVVVCAASHSRQGHPRKFRCIGSDACGLPRSFPRAPKFRFWNEEQA